MEKIIEFVKANPIPVGIGVVVLILIISSRGGGVSSDGAEAAASYNAAAAQIAGINAQTSVALGSQSIEKTKIAESAALQRTQTAATVFTALANVNATQAMNDSNNVFKSIYANIESSTARFALEKKSETELAAINAGVRMNVDKLNAELTKAKNDNNFRLSEIGALTQGNLQLIQATGTEQRLTMGQQNAFVAANLPTFMQHEENIAKIQGTTAENIARIQTQPAQTAAQGQKNKNDWGIVTDVLKIGGKIFGFL